MTETTGFFTLTDFNKDKKSYSYFEKARVSPNGYYHNIDVKIINNSSNPNPAYQNPGDAGMDLYASEERLVEPGNIVLVPTDIKISLPDGYEAQIRSRSGLAAKYGIFVLNSPGTIDSQYQGNIGIILANFGQEPFHVKVGDRIAQMVVSKYEKVNLIPVENFNTITERGSKGFGSTGV